MGRASLVEWDMVEDRDGRYTLFAKMNDDEQDVEWTQSLEQISWSDLRQLHRQLTEFIVATEHIHEGGVI